MRSTGTVRFWDFDEGQGIIDSPDTPGGCVASSYSLRCEAVTLDAAAGIASLGLNVGEDVDFVWSPGGSADDTHQVIAVWPSRCATPVLRTGAYSTALWVSVTREDGVAIMCEVDPNDLPPAPPRPPLPRTTGVVGEWHREEGWGVIESDATPGGAWVHFMEIRGGAGYRFVDTGAPVEFAWEAADQDGYAYRASDVEAVAAPNA